ncbi:MAG: ankyrin repeat domain-containing protein, partial [Thermoanaerobaculia bacterium]
PAAFAERVRREPSLAAFIDEKRSTLLHHAVVHAAVTEALIAAGADPNRRDSRGNTPVHLAGKWCALDALRSLLAAGGDASTLDSTGKTPLDWALERGREDVARFLRGEPDVEFVYIRPPVPPRVPEKFGIRISVLLTLLALFVAWVGWAILRSGLQNRRDYIALRGRGVVVEGTVVDFMEGKSTGRSSRTTHRPVVAYRSGGREYRRITDHAYVSGRPEIGVKMEVLQLPDTPETARVAGQDTDAWLLPSLLGSLGILIPLALVTSGLLRRNLF